MPILREGGGCPIDSRNDQPQTWTPPSQATIVPVDTTATQTLTNKTLENPTIAGQTPVTITAASATLGATHVNRLTVLNRATGIALTLPLATGTGNRYPLAVATTFTGAATVVTAQVTDVIAGNAIIHDTDDATVHGFSTTNATTLSLYTSSNAVGGIVGATVVLTDIANNKWVVEYQSNGASAPSTPFS
jgi:hypothetical protein